LSAARGRLLSVGDDVRGGPAVAVVSYGFWVNRLNRSEDVIGRTITLERVPFTIVGVMPAGFTGPDVGRACDVIAPLASEPLIRGQRESWLDGRSTWFLEVMVRLKPGQTVDQANAALRALQPQIREATIPPDYTVEQQARFLAPEPFTLAPAATGRSGLRTQFQQPLVIMMIVVGAVLLIACANIANLLLARATARRRDLSVRLALGASRGRIARLLLCESLLIAFGGGLLGLFVARGGASFLVSQLNASYLDTALDLRVLAFTAGVGLLTALLFGVMPALSASRVSPYLALKEQGRSIAGDRRFGFRNALIVVQVALSLALVVAAGLFIRTFQSLNQVALGVQVDPLLVVRLDAKRTDAAVDSGGRDARRRALFDRLLEAARATPGVKSAALSRIPLLTGGGSNTQIDLPDAQRGRPGIRSPWVNDVTPGWLHTYGMRLIAGRDISPQDVLGGPRVAVVNEAFVRRFFSGELPLGKHFKRGTPGGRQIDTEVVGVVSDSVYRNIRDGHPATMYLALTQLEQFGTGVALTVETEPRLRGDVQRQLGQALSAVDGNVAFTMYPLSGFVGRTLAQEKLVAILSGFFGGLALLLASVGLYGVTAYGVSRRRTEIGVRMALGADPSGVIKLILSRVAWLVGVGVVVGAAVSYWAAKFIGPALLFGLGARDARTFVLAAVVLVGVGLITAWLPARRASRIDPTQVLRES
jgi:predicted permease